MDFKQESIELAKKRSVEITQKFVEEVECLLGSGGIDVEKHNRGLLFGVALENVADIFLRNQRNTKEYKNLRNF